jgi:NTE family protein
MADPTDPQSPAARPTDPVSPFAESTDTGTAEGIGLAISGGGYRAMLFHLGSFLRLFEVGLLKKLDRISSVSGGSITSAKIAMEWGRLNTRNDFMKHVVGPIRGLAGVTIDVPSVAGGVLLPGSVADRVAKFYRKYLFGDATLQQLPDNPRFVINATSVETGSLFRFSKPYIRDWRVGKIDNPDIPLADAVTASSAFPPVLSPFVLEVDASDFSVVEPDVDPKFLSDISLTDGGVYDNLGLETVWKRYQTVLVSDAGGLLTPDPSPPADWARHALRAIDIIHGQVSSVRKRQVIASYQNGDRTGAYWGIASDIARYQLANALPAPLDRTRQLAQTATRLKRLSSDHQERLINWGYAVCDAAIRKHYPVAGAQAPGGYPYPAAGV